MNTCQECGKGFCPSRVRRVFGHLPPNYCSPQCFTAKSVALAEFQKQQVREKYADKVFAGDIIDFLNEEGYIGDDVAADADKFAGAVETLVRFLQSRNVT